MSRSLDPRVVHALLASLALAGYGAAQTPAGEANGLVGGPGYIQVWVDPCNGTDATGPAALAALDCPARPFRTITAALDAVAPFASSAMPGIVHLDPGVYSPVTNQEVFPLMMRPDVALQGVGAKRTILRGAGLTTNDVFFPASCQCGTTVPAEVLVDLSDLVDDGVVGYADFIDGVTFQGGDVQVLADGEFDGEYRISNCVFDMLDYQDMEPAVRGPYFGILMVERWDLANSCEYPVYRMHILNNTFVEGWYTDPSGESFLASRPEAVAICDTNDPLCLFGGDGDPNPGLRGVGRPNIQNNLFRTIAPAPRLPMLGIDATDTTRSIGVGPSVFTNAFDPSPFSAGGADTVTGPDYTFCVQRTVLDCSTGTAVYTPGAPPQEAIHPVAGAGGIDPGFIGELLSWKGFPISASRDWRLLPDSAMRDLGSIPVYADTDPDRGRLGAVNGTIYFDPIFASPPQIPLSSFDFDGEVYGNLRINGFVDIGFDETDLMVQCGYQNDSRSFAGGLLVNCPSSGALLGIDAYITPGAGSLALLRTRTPMVPPLGYTGALPACGTTGFFAFTTQFGADLFHFLGSLGYDWIMENPPSQILFQQLPPLSAMASTWTPAWDTVTHNFGEIFIGLDLYTTEEYRCVQGLWTPSTGQPRFSQLQSSLVPVFPFGQ